MGREEMRKEDLSSCAGFPSALAPPTLRPVRANEIENLNRPFPSSKKSRFQNEAKCETFVVKKSFICIIIKNHFHINGFALSLALKVRFFGTRKWPIANSQQKKFHS